MRFNQNLTFSLFRFYYSTKKVQDSTLITLFMFFIFFIFATCPHFFIFFIFAPTQKFTRLNFFIFLFLSLDLKSTRLNFFIFSFLLLNQKVQDSKKIKKPKRSEPRSGDTSRAASLVGPEGTSNAMRNYLSLATTRMRVILPGFETV